MPCNGGIKEIANVAGITKGVRARLHARDLFHPFECLGRRLEVGGCSHAGEDLAQLLVGVVLEADGGGETRFEARVGLDELGHGDWIARHDHHQIAAVVFHVLHQGVDRLGSVLVRTRFALRERVRLIDKEHSTERGVHHGGGLLRRLTEIAGYQLGAIDLHQVALVQKSQRPVDPRHESSDRGLTRPGIAHEHEMARHGGFRQPSGRPQGLHAKELYLSLHLRLCSIEPHQLIKLGHELLEGRLGLGRLDCFTGSRRGCFSLSRSLARRRATRESRSSRARRHLSAGPPRNEGTVRIRRSQSEGLKDRRDIRQSAQRCRNVRDARSGHQGRQVERMAHVRQLREVRRRERHRTGTFHPCARERSLRGGRSRAVRRQR